MPEETDQDEQENEQGGDSSHDPALIVRVDDADAHINLVSLVRLSAGWFSTLIVIPTCF